MLAQNSSMEEIEAMIMNASPLQLVIMTYDNAIKSLELSIEMINQGDIENRFRAVERATSFISELYMSLDHDNGGEVAYNLGSLYSFILSRLPRINFYSDKQTAMDAIVILKRLRDSWEELEAQAMAAPAAVASNETASSVAAAS